MSLLAIPMAPKKAKQTPDETAVKVDKKIVDKLAIIATRRSTSVKALVAPLLAEFVDREWPKVVAEMQKEL